MAQVQSLLVAAVAVVLVSVLPSLLNPVEGKFGLSVASPDLFSRGSDSSAVGESLLQPHSLLAKLVSSDPCASGSSVDANGHPCSVQAVSIPKLGGTVRADNVVYRVVGKHPPGVGHHRKRVPAPNSPPPPQVFAPPAPKNRTIGGHHAPGVGHRPPGFGKHPPVAVTPGSGNKGGHHPPGVGKHPPGEGHHAPGVGKRCHKDPARCFKVAFNPTLLYDPGATTCCHKRCVNLETERKHCGQCFLECRKGVPCNSGKCSDSPPTPPSEPPTPIPSPPVKSPPPSKTPPTPVPSPPAKSPPPSKTPPSPTPSPPAKSPPPSKTPPAPTPSPPVKPSPPGGRHPPGVGKRCNKDPRRCLSVSYNPQLLYDPGATTCCSKTCVNLQTNRKHCGSCFNNCRSGTCTDGVCIPKFRHPPGVGKHPPGVGKRCHVDPKRCLSVAYNPTLLYDPGATTCCHKRCTNLQTDRKHCGTCFNECRKGDQCVGGQCQVYP